MYQTRFMDSSGVSTAIFGLNGRIFARHKLINSELDIIFSSQSAKQVHVLVNGITQC